MFQYPVSKQKNYIEKFDVPKDDFERAYYQYCCQMKMNGLFLALLLNLSSLFFILIYYFKRNEELDELPFDVVFISEGASELVIPKSLKNEYVSWKVINELKEYFTTSDKKYFNSLCRRYPFSWHFLFKCLVKIRVYSYIKNSYYPKSVIVCGEYSFTSSMLTNYCEQCNINHINVMHGEKLYYIRDSFFRFTKCYVWDKYYIDLFLKLKADKKQFIVEAPRSLLFENKDKIEKTIDYTYYLGAEEGEVLERIVNAMVLLEKAGFKVSIRPHPIYTDLKEFISKSNDITIENTNEISIEKSLLRTKNAIALYSSVLNQAYHNGINVIIDDVVDVQKYDTLMDLEYIMLNKEHSLLSEVFVLNNILDC